MKLINREEFFCRQVLREFAGLEKEVVMVGVANRVEIWSKERWQECIDSYDDDMDEVAENMEEFRIFYLDCP